MYNLRKGRAGFPSKILFFKKNTVLKNTKKILFLTIESHPWFLFLESIASKDHVMSNSTQSADGEEEPDKIKECQNVVRL